MRDRRGTNDTMATLRASGSSSDLPAYYLPSCAPEDRSLQRISSKKNNLLSNFDTSDDSGDEAASDEFVHHPEKKRRLTMEQVKSLEKNFDLENKLEPERKLQIANELGLQPRQVAVWFQNRRARWKTKKLEKDYNALKMDYDSLKARHDALLQEKARNYSQLACMKHKLQVAQTQMEVHTDRMEQNKQVINPKLILESQLDDYHHQEDGDRLPIAYEKESKADKTSTVKLRSLICGADGNEESNSSTHAARYVSSKVVVKATDSARSLILSLNTCNSHTPALPAFTSKTVLRRVPSSAKEATDFAVKVEPQDLIYEDACNAFAEADEEEDIPWWDW